MSESGERAGPRRLASLGSQPSFDRAMTIPEHAAPPDGPAAATADSPTASVASLPSAGTAEPSARRFSRSQTGPQQLNRGPWSRYALCGIARNSFNSSNSSLASTTSSTAVLLPRQNAALCSQGGASAKADREKPSEVVERSRTPNMEQLTTAYHKEFLPPPFRRSVSGSLYNELTDSATFSSDNSSLSSSLSGSGRRNSFTTAWKRASKSASKQVKHVVDKFSLMHKSVSTGRLDLLAAKEFGPPIKGRTNAEIQNCPPLKPPFFAYKVLPYLWVGDLRSANNDDLLSDGGSEYEFVDFRPDSCRNLKFAWPEKRNNVLDYCLPIPKRNRLTITVLFHIMVEFCKLVNKARRDTRDGTQVLVYGPDGYNLAQMMVIGYLIAMYNEDPLVASDLVARTASRVFLEDPLDRFIWEFRSFLDYKCKTKLGRYNGDMIRIKKMEAERPFDHQYIITKAQPYLTKKWFKYVLSSEVGTDCGQGTSPCSSQNLNQIPWKLQKDDSETDVDDEIMFEHFTTSDRPIYLVNEKDLKVRKSSQPAKTGKVGQEPDEAKPAAILEKRPSKRASQRKK